MKKIIIAMAAIAAAFTMASCNKELVEPEKNTTVGESVITASIENDLTKASLEGNDTDGYKVFWSEGDNLFVGDTEAFDWEAKFTLDDSSAGSSKGTFLWHEGDYFMPLDEYYTMPKFVKGTEYQALYPFDLVEKNLGCLIWKTEQTYDTKKRYIPMFSEERCTENGTADFTFKNLGGLLRLTVKGTATISSIRISSADDEIMSGSFYLKKDVNGDFAGAMGFGSGDVFNYITLDCGTNGVELKGEQGTDFYISMPCHYIYDGDNIVALDGYSDVTITLTDIDGKTCVKKLSSSKKLVIERSKITTASFTASEFKANIPEGALPGKFTVNKNGDQVYFSQGNLTATIDATGAPTAWKFAANQYDYLGEGGANKTIGTAAGDVDLFGWSTASTTYGISTSNNHMDYSGEFVDWGKEVGDGKTWRTPTIEEWQYLFSFDCTNYGGNNYDNDIRQGRYKAGVTVCGKANCVVIVPDNWNLTANPLQTEYDIDSTPMTWEQAEKAGLVCLPATDTRFVSVIYNNDSSQYWSSSLFDEGSAYFVTLDQNGSASSIFPGDSDARCFGFSVRLVTDCE